ncbi:ERCC4 domain-containing protein [Achaetomium macrosporum]|uniref:ERCC4 domain-containing protein n=1 Tax=Achaetomium macrosporum TaxID=79813 RepID=A0AAN7CGU7_9PEZI|nr:ERCC4 domain-containing protein [Achaetomium macrosporum]
MPVEVIELLSSSPPPETGRQPSLPRARAPEATGLDSDDVFPPATSPLCNSIPDKSGLNSKPTASNSAHEIWLISDDEFSPPSRAALAGPAGGASIERPVPKRRRLDSIGRNSTAYGHGRVNSSSDRLLHSGPSRPNAEPPMTRGDRVDHDPLASSPPHVTGGDRSVVGSKLSRLSPGLDDDPFASSSPRHKEAKPAKTSTARVIDDIDPFVSSSPQPGDCPAEVAQTAALWDPISSSAPLPATGDHEPSNPRRTLRKAQSEVITLDDSEDDCIPQPDSDDDFPDISDLATSKQRFRSMTEVPLSLGPSKQPRKAKPTGKKPDPTEAKKTSLERAREKEEKAAAREAEKERKRLEKERAKEEKAQEKARAAALAEVNKIRTDKKVSTPEMIVDLPATLDETTKLQAETLLRDIEVHSTSWPSPVDNVVKWRRKVRSRYNEELGHWEPVPERIERENYAMVVIPAAQFVDLVLGEENASLESHVLRMKRHFPNDTIIYLIEGLTIWLRKNRNLRNRQFVSAVRSGLEPATEEPPSSSQGGGNPRRRKPNSSTTTQTYTDEETIEDALLQLQVLHNVLIHHTSIPVETARWIAVFTQHISTVPYRRQRDAANDAGFCMETGQVRTGDGPRDTYVRMLQEIGRVTAPIAYGIAAEFGTVAELVRGLEAGGPLTLEKVRKSVNKDGEVSDRAVGQAVSRRVYKIFTGRDETSTDI